MFSAVLAILVSFVSMENTRGQVATPCDVDYYKLGCYIDQYYSRGLPQLLFTDRDRSSPYFQQYINWKNWDQYLHSLACRCASEARNRNFSMFGLQYYGECWAGAGACDTYGQLGYSQHCVSRNYTRCDNDDENECVGGANANYVYLLTE
ncbi:uncharacterized protein LOC116305279 [Actinia tenebrosa]|uniref:Uncharacterized protein LOC116305279 n=1 Tax=Actinia tenebrosa TaxID=6105 RepID=A0A6P8IYI7_ACTTE|nr:uncharacterized protein LOC116305279 [Actinia tenebrosa]